MLGFVKNYLTKKEGMKKYEETLKQFLSDNVLDESEKAQLAEIASAYNLSPEELINAKRNGFALSFQDITSDAKITEEEKEAIQALLDYFKLDKDAIQWDQKAFNKFYTLGLIEKGLLPDIKDHDLDIIFKKDEKLHWAVAAGLKKYKRVNERINYSGFTTSVKIMKGVRYRVGSIKVTAQTKEYLVKEDVGAFWITNQRVGFRGERKTIVLPLDKILAFTLTPDGLFITKEGKETPYIIWLQDYEVVASMLSYILNNPQE